MDLGKTIRQTMEIYIKNFETLFIAGLIASLLSCITLGILAGPFMGGFLMLALKVIREEKGEINQIYNYFDKFTPLFVTTLICFVPMVIISMIPILNPVLSFILNPPIAFVWAIALIKILENNTAPLDAIKESIEMVKDYPFPIWLYSLIMAIICSIGFAFYFIGFIITAPISCVGMAVAYKELTNPTSISGNWSLSD